MFSKFYGSLGRNLVDGLPPARHTYAEVIAAGPPVTNLWFRRLEFDFQVRCVMNWEIDHVSLHLEFVIELMKHIKSRKWVARIDKIPRGVLIERNKIDLLVFFWFIKMSPNDPSMILFCSMKFKLVFDWISNELLWLSQFVFKYYIKLKLSALQPAGGNQADGSTRIYNFVGVGSDALNREERKCSSFQDSGSLSSGNLVDSPPPARHNIAAVKGPDGGLGPASIHALDVRKWKLKKRSSHIPRMLSWSSTLCQ